MMISSICFNFASPYVCVVREETLYVGNDETKSGFVLEVTPVEFKNDDVARISSIEFRDKNQALLLKMDNENPPKKESVANVRFLESIDCICLFDETGLTVGELRLANDKQSYEVIYLKDKSTPKDREIYCVVQ